MFYKFKGHFKIWVTGKDWKGNIHRLPYIFTWCEDGKEWTFYGTEEENEKKIEELKEDWNFYFFSQSQKLFNCERKKATFFTDEINLRDITDIEIIDILDMKKDFQKIPIEELEKNVKSETYLQYLKEME